MNTMTIPRPDLSGPGLKLPSLWQKSGSRPYGERRGKLLPVSLIIALHAGAFYMLQSGMLHRAVEAVAPKVVNVTFVQPPAAEQAPPPKAVPLTQPAPAIVPPPPPLLNITVENTITVPPAPARVHAEAAPAPVAAPPAPPAPAVVAAPSTPRTVQGVEYMRAPAPVYPSISRRLGETGVVMLRVLISERGLPEQATVQKSSGSGNLDEAGRQAVMRTLFKPYMEDGKAIPVYALVPINFQLS
ncbi:energy transducer TonB [Pseudoduganella namucuonensis]|uniref:Outer membrane transport energization protein TonB n=1 Tax=Pseudoduganella namucuonensis TaxID=1035707 RepID=A0A1I7LAD1_9BURK|nr:energy transducer TonB [Pseudoduganella namucuonensis]SFV06677.1 outer membrane transport energization protein TonB [Pseudoduganella namucuonensis]